MLRKKKVLIFLFQKHSLNIGKPIVETFFAGRRIFPTQNYGSDAAPKLKLRIITCFRYSTIREKSESEVHVTNILNQVKSSVTGFPKSNFTENASIQSIPDSEYLRILQERNILKNFNHQSKTNC